MRTESGRTSLNAYHGIHGPKENISTDTLLYFCPFGFPAPLFMEVLSLLNSFAKGMNSGAPGMYFLNGFGTLRPY
jgi:hypothetical protein